MATMHEAAGGKVEEDQGVSHKEIERKFLMNRSGMMALMFGQSVEPMEIDQAYPVLDNDTGSETRVRKTTTGSVSTYTLTVKGKAPGHAVGGEAGASKEGMVRTEMEISISPRDYESLVAISSGRIVRKVRWSLPLLKGLIAEVDLFAFPAHVKDKIVVEVEFPSEEAALAFKPPSAFSTEVTSDKEWKNKAIALRGSKEASA
jgi:CYTH domain-containing protein